VVLVACSAFPAKDVHGAVGIPTWRTEILTVLRPDDENAILLSLLLLLSLFLSLLLLTLSVVS
jgi:hypothetical protein